MANLRANNLTGTGGRNAIDGSVFFNGQSSLTVADNVGYEFGTGDFTIECWVNASDLKHERHLPIIQKGNSATNNLYDWRLYFNNEGTGSSILYFDIACSGTDIAATSTGVFVEDAWIHVAVTRQSGAFKVFFNGILEDTDSTTANAIDDDYTEIKIGFNDLGAAGDSYLKGYISNLRIIKGTALYTASFTPPTEKLTVVDGTTLLCCQDSDDPTQEATGKTITGYGKLAAGQPIQPKKVPPVGVDEGVTFDGDTKINTQGVMYFPTGDTSQRGRGRGVFGGGIESPNPSTTTMQYIQIQSQGNTTNFGELTVARSDISSSGNSTRGVLSGGYNPAASDVIDYVTIATTANAIDFGNLTQARGTSVGCVSSPTRGISGWGGFTGSNVNTIDYITIATTGNATDFGDTVGTNSRNTGQGSSPTRGVRGGGYTSTSVNQIDYLTIATTGNSVDFGDLTQIRYGNGGVSSNTRCIWGGGYTYSPNAHTNTMDYVTIATTGNATDFGDLISIRTGTSALGNSIRGVWFGGYSPTWVNIIDYVTIATTANASDFGDGVNTVRNAGAISDSHGGLS